MSIMSNNLIKLEMYIHVIIYKTDIAFDPEMKKCTT